MEMADWLSQFKYSPIKPLLDSGNDAIIYFAKRDLLEEKNQSIESIWDLPEVHKIIDKQLDDGSWPSKAKKDINSGVKYPLIETWKQLRFLIQQYEMDNTHPAIQKAAEFIFSCQSRGRGH